METIASTTYNDRLFKKGIRKWVHSARFRWLGSEVAKANKKFGSVMELGCFDGKALEEIEGSYETYNGYDADWEGGLSAAKDKYAGKAGISFNQCLTPDDILLADKSVSLFISLETLEHIPDEILAGYIPKIATLMQKDATLLISVPNEKGFVFFLKQVIKRLKGYEGGEAEAYTRSEFWAAVFGNMAKVERNEHKGFDWEVLRDDFSKHFKLEKVYGLQLPFLPPSLNVSIGMKFTAL